jgi:hypothetical protein
MSSGRRIDVSTLQVVAGVLASVTGALAASFLGVAGTIIGTALISLVSTLGAAWYRYVLGRSHERIRSVAADKIAPLTRDNSAVGGLHRHHGATGQHPVTDAGNGAGAYRETGRHENTERYPDTERYRVSQTQPGTWARRADDDTQAFPALGHTWGDPQDDMRTQPAARPGAQPGGGPGYGGRGDGSQDTTVTGHGGWRSGSDTSAGGRGTSWQDVVAWLKSSTKGGRPRWRNLAGAALVVFVLAMASITVIELLVGKPLDAAVYNRGGSSSPSIVQFFHGSSAAKHGSHPGTGSSSPASRSHASTAAPSQTAPSSPTTGPTSSSSPSQSASPAPSSSASPGVSRVPSTAPTVSAANSPAPAAGAATPAG